MSDGPLADSPEDGHCNGASVKYEDLLEQDGDCNGVSVKQDPDDCKGSPGDSSIEARRGDSDKDTKVSENSEGKEYSRGDLVWLRIRGHPWWPCVVVNILDVPRQNRKVRTCRGSDLKHLCLFFSQLSAMAII